MTTDQRELANLTAREWARWHNHGADGRLGMLLGEVSDRDWASAAALANAALPDADPRKLVAADVAEILSVAAFIEDGTGGYSDGSDLRRIAAKLNSLLPPAE